MSEYKSKEQGGRPVLCCEGAKDLLECAEVSLDGVLKTKPLCPGTFLTSCSTPAFPNTPSRGPRVWRTCWKCVNSIDSRVWKISKISFWQCQLRPDSLLFCDSQSTPIFIWWQVRGIKVAAKRHLFYGKGLSQGLKLSLWFLNWDSPETKWGQDVYLSMSDLVAKCKAVSFW